MLPVNANGTIPDVSPTNITAPGSGETMEELASKAPGPDQIPNILMTKTVQEDFHLDIGP